MMMRRYRFVEEGLTIGIPETEQVIEQTKANFKLWNRVDAKQRNVQSESNIERYQDIISREKDLLFTGFARFLEDSGDGHCDNCKYRDSYGAETSHQFGGVELCDACKQTWRASIKSFPTRALKAFPEFVLRDGSVWYNAPM